MSELRPLDDQSAALSVATLGATALTYCGMVLGDGRRLTTIGVAALLVLAAIASHVVASPYGVSAIDPVAYGSMSALLLAVALFATWLPARRAAATNPVRVIRGE